MLFPGNCGILKKMIIKSDSDSFRNYLEDSSNLKGGRADTVVMPESSEELASFMKEANSKRMPVTVSGGGTGTTGSRIPFGGAVLSTEKLNKIVNISTSSMSATVESGVLVEELKGEAEKLGLFYTSHPTEKLAFVGGTISTNASGSRSYRYGPTRRYVKRLKMILANGEPFEISRGSVFLTRENSSIKTSGGRVIHIPMPSYRMPDVKSSAGYFIRDGMDLIDLFIGQEGTLSVITEAQIGLVRKPAAILSSFVFFNKEEGAIDFSEEVKGSAGLDILSIEYFDHNAIGFLRPKNSNIPGDAAAAVFFEQDTEGKDEDSLMAGWTQMVLKHGSSLDLTWVAMSERDAESFTRLRYAVPESINESIRRSGWRKFSTDIAVPSARFREMTAFYMDTFRKEKIGHVIFGHIGENHLHVNILPESNDEAKIAEELSLLFVRKAIALGGTVAAEHGVGKLKHKYLKEMYGEGGVREMAMVKKAFDPNCILGLDNIFPKEILA